jgi:two-component system, sporulation sensor kinase E
MFVAPNQSFIKWGIIIFAVLIGVISVFYTNYLVEALMDRERKQIDLFAKVQTFAVNSSDTEKIAFLLTEFLDANHSISVILADTANNPLSFKNIEIPQGVEQNTFLKKQIEEMKEQHPPIIVEIDKNWQQYIYYKNSQLVTQLRYFPFVQLSVICVFFAIVYLTFAARRRAEQNSVWIGLAKETAHQLGTPLSSLMAWLEYFKADDAFDQSITIELQKDIQRLEMITSRFSNIGSTPLLKNENVFEVVTQIVVYLQKRISSKVKINIKTDSETDLVTLLNRPLFEWVIENLCKNAVDAMGGIGQITIEIINFKNNTIQLDITDSGKGMSQKQAKQVFVAGFTTKKRGWGLGLTLAKRIIENYHNGKIMVLKSEVNVGTTFRIILAKKLAKIEETITKNKI